MKKLNFKIGYIIGIFLFGLISCKKFLSVVPKNKLSDINMFQSKQNSQLFLNGIYARIPGSFQTDDPLDNYSDNSIAAGGNLTSRKVYQKGEYDASSGITFSRSWKTLYTAIRSTNVFIQKLKDSEGVTDDEWKRQKLAESRFLRAYFYQLLWVQYGGVPIIKVPLDYNEMGDDIFRGRNTDDEVVDFIVKECKEIAGDLPLQAEGGLATRGAALALEGWVELYYASPLKNPSNDLDRWQNAADTYQKIIDLGVYSLFPDYGNTFLEENNGNEEIIFAKQYLGGTSLGSSREGLQGPWHAGPLDISWNGVDPTQELVDSYFMNNGLPIDDPASGYDLQNPYANRGERFYESIVYDGSTYLGYTMVMKQGLGSDIAPTKEGHGALCGYFLRKGMNTQYSVKGHNNLSSCNEIIYRYGGVLLSFAEAENEAVGPNASVYDAINEVRARVDLPSLPSGLNQVEMRDAIHQERRVELAFEGKRLYDLLRWKEAEDKLNTHFHGMWIEKDNGNWNYSKFEVAFGESKFKKKSYLLPIPQNAIEANPKLDQNSGF